MLFADHDFLELQLRDREQSQVDGADLDRLPEPRLRRLFVRTGFQGDEGERGNRDDQGQEQHHRKLLREAAGPSLRPELPGGKRGFLGIAGLFVAPPCLMFRPRRLAGFLSRLRLRLFLCADPLLLFLGTLLLFLGALVLILGALVLILGAPRLFLGFATGPLLLLPAQLFLALPVLRFASRVLLLLPQRTLEGFAVLRFPALPRLFFRAAPQLFFAPRSLLFLAARPLLDFPSGTLLRLAPHALLGVPLYLLFRFATRARGRQSQ